MPLSLFQSTLPVRGATPLVPIEVAHPQHISIHAPREGSDVSARIVAPLTDISIHAPREGSDRAGAHQLCDGVRFQSTLPVRGATAIKARLIIKGDISIHAPREGSDPAVSPLGSGTFEFQSTLPVRGATEVYVIKRRKVKPFQSTLPVRGATANISKMLRVILDRFSNF